MRKSLFFLSFLITLSVSAQDSETPEDGLLYSVFLIGDAGEPYQHSKDPNLSLLEEQLKRAGENSAVVFLGDNIYPRGLPAEGRKERKAAESRLLEQLKILKNYSGKVVFVPGNHDWDRGGRYGFENIKIQQKFIEKYIQKDSVFLPLEGCPGPLLLPLTKEIKLVVMDTQWFLHKWEKPDAVTDCRLEEGSSPFDALGSVLEANKADNLIVVSHHPMFSAGTHGGHHTWIDHIFPLTLVRPYLFIPLPIIGSIVPLYRKFYGHIQDIPHPKYSKMKRSFLKQIDNHPNLVHAAGHEHALQYFKKNGIHHIVSGSGTKTSSLKKNNDSEFAASIKGFARINYLNNQEVWLEFWIPSVVNNEEQMIYREKLYDHNLK